MKEPKWRTEWNAIVGDAPYLRVRNYEKYQTDWQPTYVQDHYNKDEDPNYYTRPVTQRWMMDWCRRQCGRLRHNLYSDPIALVKRMNLVTRYDQLASTGEATTKQAASSHRADYTHLLSILRAGFLIPCYELDTFPKTPNISKNKQIKHKQTEPDPVVDSSTKEQPQDQPQVPAVTPTKKRGFDVHDIQPFGGHTKDDLNFVRSFHWLNPKSPPWYRENIYDEAGFQRFFQIMKDKTPSDWKPSKVKLPCATTKRSFKPDGTEYPGGWDDGDHCPLCENKGINLRTEKFCPCTKWYLADGSEIDPEENRWRSEQKLMRG